MSLVRHVRHESVQLYGEEGVPRGQRVAKEFISERELPWRKVAGPHDAGRLRQKAARRVALISGELCDGAFILEGRLSTCC